MIARITGVLEQVENGVALVVPVSSLGAGGVAYEVLVPAYLGARLLGARGLGGAGGKSLVGGVVTLHTIEYLESQGQGSSFIPRLIGFGAPLEREFFDLLTSVKGLGNKRALRAMVSEPGLIARAIHDRDTRALQRLPEIGPKLAELIVHELKNKVARFTMMRDLGNLGAGAATRAPAGTAASGAAASTSAPAAEVEAKAAETNGKPARRRRASGGAPAAQEHAPAPAAPAPSPPIRETIETLIALGEAPMEAERLVSRALDRARSTGEPVPVTPQALLAAAYAAR